VSSRIRGAFEVPNDKTAGHSSSKVKAGSFKGYVAPHDLNQEGKRLSAKIGNDWVIVPSIPAAAKNLCRLVPFVGPGVELSVRIYIDRVLIDTIDLKTQ
jgi:hypothetical protein